MAYADIHEVIKAASREMPRNLVVTKRGTPDEGYSRFSGISGAAGSSGVIRLVDLVPRVPEEGTRMVSQPAGEEESLAAALARSSRFLQAGARFIPVDTAPAANATEGPIPLWSRAGSFTVVNGADFAIGDELNPLSASSLPVSSEQINIDLMESYGVRFELSRRTQKDMTGAELNARLVNAITFGIARAVEKIALGTLADKLLEAGGGTTMPTYSLSAAAAKGLRFGELAAIIGTSGTGATITDGVLRVSGVPAELTGEHSATFVGAFDRAAVAVMDDVRVLVERLDVNGAMAVTCWFDAMALVPDTGFFWSVE
jgi:hypothetical protein